MGLGQRKDVGDEKGGESEGLGSVDNREVSG